MLRSHGNSYVHLLHSFHQVQSSIIVPWPVAHLSASLLHDERHGGALIEQSQLAILANGQWQSMIVTDSHWQVSGKFMHLMRLGHHLQKVTSMCSSERLPMTCIRIPLAKCNEKHLRATFAVAPDSSCRRGMQKCHHTEEFGGCHPPQTLSSFHTECNFNEKKPSCSIKIDKAWQTNFSIRTGRWKTTGHWWPLPAQLQHCAGPTCTCKNPIYASWVHIKTLQTHTHTHAYMYTHADAASILKPFTSHQSILKEITPKQSLNKSLRNKTNPLLGAVKSIGSPS